MANYIDMINQKRLDNAKTSFEGLQQAEADAAAALTKAQADAKAAHATAQSCADHGDGAKELEAAELLVDGAERAVRSAGRLLEAATKKRELGAVTRDRELAQAHGVAMTEGFRRFLGIRSEAAELLAKLAALSAEHVAVTAEFRALANAARMGHSSLIENCPRLTDDRGQLLMNQAEFDNRLHQDVQWNVAANKPNWVE